ncbi:ankyrin repeat and protein kinase domain-containing protein [Colletotrichum kahawae]|uniref:Ankyrin repeat and protein kinase domain-containing protein n=1 Tax=Colletotrichum kahawae TaxID=34407 RepID=A0AAD9YK74_COLKA|nr:ankyrin repeat and protein kinase domain-containing protein [Colletotrichum kahawae]
MDIEPNIALEFSVIQELPPPVCLLDIATTDTDLAAFLEQADADINIQNEECLTALHLAVLSHSETAVRALLSCGADVEAVAADDRRPLFMAVNERCIEIVQALLEYGAVPDAPRNWWTPLHAAALDGNIEIARILLDYGADVSARCYQEEFLEREPLYFAVEGRNSSIVELLLDHGADPDSVCRVNGPPTALHLACDIDNFDAVKLLLERGASINEIRDSEGGTPLFRAVAANNMDIVMLLLGRGAKTQIWRPDGLSVIDLAEDNDEMLRLLQGERIRQGPSVRGFEETEDPDQLFDMLRPPAFPDQTNRDIMVACEGFEAICIDFFTESNGEKYLEKTVSIYDLLYSHGPEAKRSRLNGFPAARNPALVLFTFQLCAHIAAIFRAIVHIHCVEMMAVSSQLSFKGKIHDWRWWKATSGSDPAADEDLERQSESLRSPVLDAASNQSQLMEGENITRNVRNGEELLRSRTSNSERQPVSSRASPGVDNGEISDAGQRNSPVVEATPPMNDTQTEFFGNEDEAQDRNQPPVQPEAVEPDDMRGSFRQSEVTPAQKPTQPRWTVPPRGNLHEYLIKGYFVTGQEQLQPRLPLDRYVHAHIETTSHSDDDQVIYRYTNNGQFPEPMIFMVDQLWLWVLGNVGSVYDLAGLITTSCVDLFDPQRVNEDYLFFDFFERSIVRANDKVTNYLRDFRELLREKTHELMDIVREMELMIEVNDILDELRTLKQVLTDQKAVISTLNSTLGLATGNPTATTKPPSVVTRTLERHLERIDQMQQAATEADKSATIFAINTNGFPLDDNDRIPFDYLMKHILTIGLGLSVPLIVIAFNVDRIAGWFNLLRDAEGHLWQWGLILSAATAIYLGTLMPVWLSELSPGMKSAVSIFVTIVALALGVAYGLYRFAQRGLQSQDEASDTSSMTSSRFDDD